MMSGIGISDLGAVIENLSRIVDPEDEDYQ